MERKDYQETQLVIVTAKLYACTYICRVPLGQWALEGCKECPDLMDQKEPQEKLDPWYV